MRQNLKKMISYYKPYLHIFWADMFFATLSAGVALVIPLVVRYVTSTLIYCEADVILHQMVYIAIGLFVLLALVKNRSPRRFLYGILCCMPSLLLGGVYLCL